jgi:hypothetical protein
MALLWQYPQKLLLNLQVTSESFSIFIKKQDFFPGQKNSMGTPLLCCTQTIQDNPFDESQRWPDDAEQCFRWKSFWVRDFLLQMLKSGKLVILDSWSLGRYGECMEVQISKSISHSHLIGLGVGR